MEVRISKTITRGRLPDRMIGVRAEDTIVLFSRSGEPIVEPVRIELPSTDKPLHVLLTDMMPGQWRIEETGETVRVCYPHLKA